MDSGYDCEHRVVGRVGRTSLCAGAANDEAKEHWVNVANLAEESAARVTDTRRKRRVATILRSIAAAPSATFPNMMSEAELEGFYRLVNNQNEDWSTLLAGHREATMSRAAKAQGLVLAIHDTTESNYRRYDAKRQRKGLAVASRDMQRLHLHTSLVAEFSPRKSIPLGVGDMQPFVHGSELKSSEAEEFWRKQGGLYSQEQQRWLDGILRVESALSTHGVSAVHICDRENDRYPILAWLESKRIRFVQRLVSENRRVDDELALPAKALAAKPPLGTLDVQIQARAQPPSSKDRKAHPARKARCARLSIHAATLSVLRPNPRNMGYSPIPVKELPAKIQMNLVLVCEVNPPPGEKAIEWLLATSESIETFDDVRRVTDLYNERWLIEEFFKALKTGCRMEERQAETAASILSVIALLVPVAWRLLMLRALEQHQPDAPATVLFTGEELDLIWAATKKEHPQGTPTLRESLLAVARLGGHLRSNGAPGWITLMRGMSRLDDLCLGATLAAQNGQRGDA